MSDFSLSDLPDRLRTVVARSQDLLNQGILLTEIPRRLILEFGEVYPVLCDALYRLGHAAAWRDECAALLHIWGEPAADDAAFAAALYALMHYSGDHKAAAACINRCQGRRELAEAIVNTLENS